MLIENRPSHLN
jgi:hypothetical protein